MNHLFVKEICLPLPSEVKSPVYPFSLPIVQNLQRLGSLHFKSPVTFIVGENGAGKSTLLEAIAGNLRFNAEGGSRNFNFYTAETHSVLFQHVKIKRGPYLPQDGYFLRAESFYNLATEIEHLDLNDSYGGASLHKQSHGEGFFSLIMNRFRGNGLYLLDEPEAALSPLRQLALLSRIHQLVHTNSQFIIATHSPILLAYPGAEIYLLTDDGIVLTPYEETEHYIITKQFLNNSAGMLDNLFDSTDK